jgi:hypothetical protein
MQRTLLRGGHVLSMDPRIGVLRDAGGRAVDGRLVDADMTALGARAEASAEQILERVHQTVAELPGTPSDAAANLGPLITYHLGC